MDISVFFDGKNWGNPLENTYLKKLSQEHGIIRTNKANFPEFKIGELIAVLPVHSCLSMDAIKPSYQII